MIVHASKGGGLANRLWSVAHLFAWSFENDVAIAGVSIDEYAHLYPAIARDPFVSGRLDAKVRHHAGPVRHLSFEAARVAAALSTRSLLPRRWIRTISIAWDEWFDLDQPGFLAVAHSCPIVLLRGFLFVTQASLENQADAVRELLRPSSRIVDLARRQVKMARQGSTTLIGVHVRRGDYRSFMGGRFHYPISVYEELLTQAVARFADGSVAFVIVSDEPESVMGLSAGHATVTVSTEAPAVDLELLSQCDYMIGPPSTFNRWASFYGNVPLFTIESPDQSLDRGEFVVASTHFVPRGTLTHRSA